MRLACRVRSSTYNADRTPVSDTFDHWNEVESIDSSISHPQHRLGTTAREHQESYIQPPEEEAR